MDLACAIKVDLANAEAEIPENITEKEYILKHAIEKLPGQYRQ